MFLIIIFLILCAILGYLTVCRYFLPRVNELVPTCPGNLPIVGHSHKLLTNETLHRNLVSFGEYALKVGGVAKVFIGPLPVYVVTDPIDATTVLNKCLRKMFVYNFIAPMVGKQVMAAEVPIWKRNRRILDLCFKQHILDDYLELFNDKAGQFVELLAQDVGKGEVDLTQKITKTILETACQSTFGVKVDGKDLVDDNLMEALDELLKILVARITKPWLMFDFIFNLSSYKEKLSEALGTADRYTEPVVQLRKSEYLHRLKNKENIDCKGTGTTGRKFQSVLEILIENIVTETGSLFTDAELKNIADNVVVGAFDTTINEMLFIFACIGSYPEVQEKIYQEISQVVGVDGIVSKQNISKLVYLEAAIKESIRLYPIGVVVAREATVDTKLRNVTIPAGSSILVHIWSINRNTNYWGSEPEEFKPERWLSSDTAPSHKAAFATFSPGLRGCIGKTYALMFLKVAMALVIRKFKVTADHTKIKINFNVFLKPKSGHFVKIEERRSNK